MAASRDSTATVGGATLATEGEGAGAGGVAVGGVAAGGVGGTVAARGRSSVTIFTGSAEAAFVGVAAFAGEAAFVGIAGFAGEAAFTGALATFLGAVVRAVGPALVLFFAAGLSAAFAATDFLALR